MRQYNPSQCRKRLSSGLRACIALQLLQRQVVCGARRSHPIAASQQSAASSDGPPPFFCFSCWQVQSSSCHACCSIGLPCPSAKARNMEMHANLMHFGHCTSTYAQPVFAAMLSCDMKESKEQEKSKRARSYLPTTDHGVLPQSLTAMNKRVDGDAETGVPAPSHGKGVTRAAHRPSHDDKLSQDLGIHQLYFQLRTDLGSGYGGIRCGWNSSE
eukprot:6477988-Amphidinium_carterae.1